MNLEHNYFNDLKMMLMPVTTMLVLALAVIAVGKKSRALR
jgi:hypothetical protein